MARICELEIHVTALLPIEVNAVEFTTGNIPSGQKPGVYRLCCGAAEAAPFQNRLSLTKTG
jgi:hypothetical protein